MAALQVVIPAELADALRLPSAERGARVQLELAIRLYQKGLLPFGKARRLAGLSVWEFGELLGREGIARRYDEVELAEDLQWLQVAE